VDKPEFIQGVGPDVYLQKEVETVMPVVETLPARGASNALLPKQVKR
jgi:hypothetical protein